MKTNLTNGSRGARVESREQNRTDNRPAATGVSIRHLRPQAPPTIQHPGSSIQAPLSSASQPATCNGQSGPDNPATTCALTNTDGFWELSFYGRSAVLKQHPALFHVAWLLAHAPAEPVAALDLAGHVFRSFHAHQDLLRCARWLCRQQRDADVAKVFRKKQRALEKILDGSGETEVEKTEAQRELIFLEHLLATYFVELIPPGEKTAARIAEELLDLHANLSTAMDAQGNPHPVIRAFALHLLVCVLMPSVRASRGAAGARYVYRSLGAEV
jgi:hypothetical protein